ncbi:hypothetical protein MIR68_004308 [Amoeboaphelidium protococcarum]|nr:hypothetical protein MIR68_004308 [Amoeboaphelidium protococcarum]
MTRYEDSYRGKGYQYSGAAAQFTEKNPGSYQTDYQQSRGRDYNRRSDYGVHRPGSYSQQNYQNGSGAAKQSQPQQYRNNARDYSPGYYNSKANNHQGNINGGARTSSVRQRDDYSLQQQPQQHRRQELAEIKAPQYKLELCQTYMDTGMCGNGLYCKFAHGQSEVGMMVVEKDFAISAVVQLQSGQRGDDYIAGGSGVRHADNGNNYDSQQQQQRSYDGAEYAEDQQYDYAQDGGEFAEEYPPQGDYRYNEFNAEQELFNRKDNHHHQFDERKFRTAMCSYFVKTGHCRFGDDCKFAHSKDQLQKPQSEHSYGRNDQAKDQQFSQQQEQFQFEDPKNQRQVQGDQRRDGEMYSRPPQQQYNKSGRSRDYGAEYPRGGENRRYDNGDTENDKYYPNGDFNYRHESTYQQQYDRDNGVAGKSHYDGPRQRGPFPGRSTVGIPADQIFERRANSSHYKSTLCKYFEESGRCKLGDTCTYAHGRHELRQPSSGITRYSDAQNNGSNSNSNGNAESNQANDLPDIWACDNGSIDLHNKSHNNSTIAGEEGEV